MEHPPAPDPPVALASARRVDPDGQSVRDRYRYCGPHVAWGDVVGHAAAKRELQIIAEQLRRSSVAARLGLEPVKGIALLGAPGVGKSLLAMALASAVERPVYVVPAADLDEQGVRDLYGALAGEPCVVILEEADLVLRNRWHQRAPEDGRLAAALCVAMDSTDAVRGPITVALTADEEYVLDRSALRAGRLTTKIRLDLPTAADRLALWERYTSRVPVSGPLDLEVAVDRSTDMTGADIAATVMVALGLGMVDGTDALGQAQLDEALLRRHHVDEHPAPTPEERWATAVHEAGHAAYAALAWGSESLATVTISPSVDDAGRTLLADAWRDEARLDRRRLRESVGLDLAGMVAEALELGDDRVGAGCVADLRRANEGLRRLAGELGASEVMGPIWLDAFERGEASDRGSEAMRARLWTTVARDAGQSLEACRATLAPHHGAIVALAERLIAAPDGTLSGAALDQALRACGLGMPGSAARADGTQPDA
jgi:cell division protease FtsH